jgi:hypothetical protein
MNWGHIRRTRRYNINNPRAESEMASLMIYPGSSPSLVSLNTIAFLIPSKNVEREIISCAPLVYQSSYPPSASGSPVRDLTKFNISAVPFGVVRAIRAPCKAFLQNCHPCCLSIPYETHARQGNSATLAHPHLPYRVFLTSMLP